MRDLVLPPPISITGDEVVARFRDEVGESWIMT